MPLIFLGLNCLFTFLSGPSLRLDITISFSLLILEHLNQDREVLRVLDFSLHYALGEEIAFVLARQPYKPVEVIVKLLPLKSVERLRLIIRVKTPEERVNMIDEAILEVFHGSARSLFFKRIKLNFLVF